MKIATKGRTGLNILLDIATYGANKPRKAKDIAASQDIPETDISQRITELQQARLIQSTCEDKDGYTLSRSTENISLLEIVAAMEGRINIVDSTILNSLSSLTLKDIIERAPQENDTPHVLDFCI